MFQRHTAVGVLFIVMHVLLPNPWSGGQETTVLTVTPDAKIQATIHRVVIAKDDKDKDARLAMEKLNLLIRKSPDVLAPQLVYYKMQVKEEQAGFRTIGMMAHFTRTWASEIRRGLIPLLETKNDELRREVALWLANADNRLAITGETNLMHYRQTLLRQKESPPPRLVDYVFGYPGQALLLFGEIYSEKPKFGEPPRALVWSDHVISTVKWRLLNRFLQDGDLEKAQKELDALSKHEGWYARRYVVQVLREVPKLGTREIVERLQNDSNPLVSDAAKLIEAP
jgi:hypothetical protein